ncbi:class I SAM-dependent methyltransferase [Povalibacter sp.]|uniref:class I SAM-dependent methyltransferase n=1 Tax=Povalibacter sp. TaxID=1962978 RepID=UPI002F41C1E2
MSFKDHFSGHAALYAKYRPDYPPALYEFLATLTRRHDYALDCATGNGQAAIALARYFDCVIATDGSVPQLLNAQAHERVRYVANLAEQPAFRDGSIDLVVAAQAAHWFDHSRFYAGVRRVLRPDGALALWTYGLTRIDPKVDAIVRDFYDTTVGKYWPPERRYVEDAYRTLPFELNEVPVPSLELRLEWDLGALMGYLSTWSAVQRYVRTLQLDPLPALRERLATVWRPGEQRVVIWPLHLRVGRPQAQ